VVWENDADALKDEFSKCNNDKNTSLDVLLKILERATQETSERKGVKSLEWKKINGYIEKPCKVPKSAIGTRQVLESLFYSEVAEDE
jgi:hypothetical protein